MATTDQDSTNLKDFRSYYSGELSAKQQHHFERRLLEDPLFADAYEGFVAMIENEIEPELFLTSLNAELENRLSKPKYRVVPVWPWTAAASVILCVSWVIYTNQQRDMVSVISGEHLKSGVRRKNTSVSDSVLIGDSTSPKRNPFDSMKDRIASVSSGKDQDIPSIPLDIDIKLNRLADIDESNVVVDTMHVASRVAADTQLEPSTALYKKKSGHGSDTGSLLLPRVSRPASAPVKKETLPSIIAGTVVDETGRALPGVSVTVSKGSGTATDSLGNFRITGQATDSLKLAFIGYKSMTIPADRAGLALIKLENDQLALEEVVVVGYGKTKKISAVTGSFIKASPVGGWTEYRKYLYQKSSDLPAGRARVTFTVNQDGSLIDFVVKGNTALHEAAINRIKDGPQWQSAVKNNANVSDKVTVTLVFSRK